MEHGGHHVTREVFEENLALKLEDSQLVADIGPLLSAGYEWDPVAEAKEVASLLAMLPGMAWKRPAE